MPKYRFTIQRLKNGRVTGLASKATIEADNYYEAKRIAEEQFDKHRITNLTQVKEKGPSAFQARSRSSQPFRPEADVDGSPSMERGWGAVGGLLFCGAVVIFLMGRCSAETDGINRPPAAVDAPVKDTAPQAAQPPMLGEIKSEEAPLATSVPTEAESLPTKTSVQSDVVEDPSAMTHRPPVLLTFYALVRLPSGVEQTTEVQASNERRAKEILRDFRGDPKVLEGPTTTKTW